jgi:thymidylate kinase
MIIVEGTDKSGKSTFISDLIKHFPSQDKKSIRVHHFGLLPEDWNYGDDYIHYIRPDIILDRFVDSERVYGPVYRGKVNPKLDEKNLMKIYEKCISMGALVVYCNPEEHVVMNRINKHGDELISKQEQLKMLRKGFDDIYNNPAYPLEVVKLNTSGPLNHGVFKNIISKSSALKRTAENISNRNYRGFISPSAKYLVYTNCLDIALEIILMTRKDIPISRFALIRTRNTDNNPVNISEILSLLPDLQQIAVFGTQKEHDDYTSANNKMRPEICINKNISQFARWLENLK